MRTYFMRLLALLLVLIAVFPLPASGEGGLSPEQQTYLEACEAAEDGRFYTAISALETLGDYLDCPQRIVYYTLRQQESWHEPPLQAWYSHLAMRYAELGDYLDCPRRSADLQAKADAIVAEDLALLDDLIAQKQYDEACSLIYDYDGTYGSELVALRRPLLQDIPLQAILNQAPDGSYMLDIFTASSEIIHMMLTEDSTEASSRTYDAIRLPYSTLPLSLSADDAWTLTLAKRSRKITYLTLTLPNGSEIQMTAPAAQAAQVDAALALYEQVSTAAEIVKNDDGHTLTLTGPDGTSAAVQLSKLNEKPAWNPDARFAVALNADAVSGTITFNPGTDRQLTLEFSDYLRFDTPHFYPAP